MQDSLSTKAGKTDRRRYSKEKSVLKETLNWQILPSQSQRILRILGQVEKTLLSFHWQHYTELAIIFKMSWNSTCTWLTYIRKSCNIADWNASRLALRFQLTVHWSRQCCEQKTMCFGWSHNLVPVTKRDGNIRITMDFTSLNPKITPSRHPLPNICDVRFMLIRCALHMWVCILSSSLICRVFLNQSTDKKQSAMAS